MWSVDTLVIHRSQSETSTCFYGTTPRTPKMARGSRMSSSGRQVSTFILAWHLNGPTSGQAAVYSNLSHGWRSCTGVSLLSHSHASLDQSLRVLSSGEG